MSGPDRRETVGESTAASRDYLPLSRAALREVGPAAQTLGALYWLADKRAGKKTFAAIGTIAQIAGLPRRSVQRHLKILQKSGWVANQGRAGRRTVTHALSPKAAKAKEPFHPLPIWAATLSTFGQRVLVASLENAARTAKRLNSAGRDWVTLAAIERETGLTAATLREARDQLRTAGLIDFFAGEAAAGIAPRIALRQEAADTLARGAQKVAQGGAKSGARGAQKVAQGGAKSGARSYTTLLRELWSEHASRREADQIPIFVDRERDSGLAHQALRAIHYTGADGALVWKAAAWVNTGAISEAQFASAYQGVRVIEPANAPAYFRAILNDTLGEARLRDLERRTSLPRDLVPGAPSTVVADLRRKRPPKGNPVEIAEALEGTLPGLTQESAGQPSDQRAA